MSVQPFTSSSYSISSHLYRPSTVSTFIRYPNNDTGNSSQIISPFNGDTINANFYNLAGAIIDTQGRVSNLEGNSRTAGDSQTGFIAYDGLKETPSAFYGGASFNLVGATPITADPSGQLKTVKFAFDNGIVFNSGVPSSSASALRSIDFFKDTSFSFALGSEFESYLNTRFRQCNNNTTGGDTFGFDGSYTGTDPIFGLIGVTPSSPSSTFNTATTNKSFLITVNDDITTKKTINLGTTQYATLDLFISAIRNALAVAYLGSFNFTVEKVAGFAQITISKDRASAGAFSFQLETDAGNDNAGSMLTWLGWLRSSYKTVNTFDYSSLIKLKVSGNTAPYQISIIGVSPGFQTYIVDGISPNGLLAFCGIAIPYNGIGNHTGDNPGGNNLNFAGTFKPKALLSESISLPDGSKWDSQSLISAVDIQAGSKFILPSASQKLQLGTTSSIYYIDGAGSGRLSTLTVSNLVVASTFTHVAPARATYNMSSGGYILDGTALSFTGLVEAGTVWAGGSSFTSSIAGVYIFEGYIPFSATFATSTVFSLYIENHNSAIRELDRQTVSGFENISSKFNVSLRLAIGDVITFIPHFTATGVSHVSYLPRLTIQYLGT